MKRLTLFAAAALLGPAVALAHGDGAKKPAGKLSTVKGEIVDLACYLHDGDRGASHKKCASLCMAKGIPFGVLSADGKLTLIVPDHDDEAPYEQLKELAAEQVSVTGDLVKSGGLPAIRVSSIEPPKGWKPSANAGAGASVEKAYYCPMKCAGSDSDVAGKCPVCGMSLVKREAPAPMSAEKPKLQKAYYCPMDPDVESEKAGLCPKCGMDLVKRKQS